MTREAVVCVRNLRTQFGPHLVHEGLDLDLFRGEILGVVGASGSGKSVLLRAIVGLEVSQAGTIEVLGKTLAALPGSERRAVEQRWGVMFQDGALFSSLTVRENVEVPLRAVPGLTDAQRRGLAELKVSMAGLPWKANNNYPSELSGGMRKRAGLARALALDPEILFLDEPTAGLDPIGAAAFDRLILTLRDALNLSVFLVTHDLDTLHACCDRVAVLAEHKVLTTGTMADMLKVDHPWVHEYFHGARARAASGGNPDRD
ncbi:ABC transporter ATP-binding protein [Paracoccus benzoatiresistens]|uniref:ATP-binding cassette domain-containing protein n=1 Tax=Paracoccus benzoatiresistens TaxID=2997341 RepID=A0ABT4J9I2_9RHOB|nr:ATP-binding cassette domain-containing protein [Paracoccus sp. EF6]MCZ0963737.1 ATP-binding cassette domain-containing protein [Paracoccus sp. EF6]